MNLKKELNKAFSLVGLKLSRVPSPLFRNPLFLLPREDYQIVNKKVYLKRLSLDIPAHSSHPLIQGYNDAVRIVEKGGGTFSYDQGKLMLNVGGVQFFINDAEELYIINEVFSEGCYNIFAPHENVVVIDVGMNVAVTSLFLSAKSNVEKVYAFELFPPTFETAMKNIRLNACGSKIVPNKFGLGRSSQKLQLPYSPERKGRMGVNGLPADVSFGNSSMQEVEIRKVSTVFNEIVAAHPGSYIVCKMDCEGAEYEIMEDLQENNGLSKADVYMIEWHYKKPVAMVESLVKSNFTVFYLTFSTGDSGLIYAVQSGAKSNGTQSNRTI